MGQFLEQAKHNEGFHKFLSSISPDKFVDWKIICLFYAALHLVKELAQVKKVRLGDSHNSILSEINPINKNRKLIVKRDFYETYNSLYMFSRDVRYDGFLVYDEFEKALEPVYLESQKNYLYLKKEVIRLGVRI
jgi:hypothetical protein